MKFTLSLTHRCNLACKYCYAKKTSKRDMSLETAKTIIDFALHIIKSDQMREICFFGGEPILVFDLLENIIHYIQTQKQDITHNVHLNVTTNGTLLTHQIIKYFRDENVSLCISIDGPAHVHNHFRRYPDGRKSYTDVIMNLQRALRYHKNVQVNAVYGPETINFLPETVSFFIRQRVSTIHLNPDITADWSSESYAHLKYLYMQIAQYYIQSYEQGKELAINFLDNKIIAFLKRGYTTKDKCGMGETEWGFAPSGNIYPCERFIGDDNDLRFCLGNIHTGLDLNRRCSLIKQRGNRNEECKTCNLQKYCMNWCGCTNYYMNGYTDVAGRMMCANEQATIATAYQVLLALKDNDLFLDHFSNYFQCRGITTECIKREVII